MKRIIYLLGIAAALLLGAASACDKEGKNPGGGNTPPSDGRLTPATVSLLEFFDNKIEEYGKDSSTPLSRIYICGHRANTYASSVGKIPENSIPNIEMAIEKGLDMIEIDVRVTSDGVPMLMHDDALSNTTTGSGNLSSKTYDQVRALNMKHRSAKKDEPYSYKGHYVKVPTLVEALQACKGKIYVNLDVKSCPVPTLMGAIRDAGMIDQVMIYGLNDADRKDCITWAAENLSSLVAIHPYISKPADINSYAKGYFGCAKLFQYSYEIYYNNSIAGFGYQCHAQGGLSYSNSLNYDSQILNWYNNYYLKGVDGSCQVLDKFIASGSDFIQTDYFELAELYLKSKGLR